MRASRRVSRTTLIVLIALGATFAGFVLASNAQRLSGDESEVQTASVAAGPQTAELGWRETYGRPRRAGSSSRSTGSTSRRPAGARASASRTTPRSAGSSRRARRPRDRSACSCSRPATSRSSRSETGTTRCRRSARRRATRPRCQRSSSPATSWEGEISAPGALVAGSWARVVFGTLVAVGKPPDELEEMVIWITDNAYELEE